jgi:hypothetical protein
LKLFQITFCVGAFAFSLTGCKSLWQNHPQSKVAQTDGFSLKLTKLGTADPLPFSRYEYLIESGNDTGQWTPVHRWSQDDPWDLSEVDIKVINSQVAYFFNVTFYGVTVDGGKNWAFFNVHEARESLGIQHAFYPKWPRVEVRADGSGSLYMQGHDGRGKADLIFETADFGQTWSPARFGI